MADLFKSLKPKKQVSKNGFDLSQKHVFSTRAGLLSPVACVECVPGDFHEIDLAAFMRSNTLSTAAFLRGKFTFDAYFVPYVQLWHPFNQLITQRVDKHSANQKGTAFVPNIRLGSEAGLLNVIYRLYRGGYGYSPLDGEDVDEKYFARQGYSSAYSMVRLLDMLGYGDHSYVLNSNESEVDIMRYIDQYSDQYVNLFRVAAYQHIWYDVYRNKYYDLDGSDNIDFVQTFNFDDIDCSTFATSHLVVPQRQQPGQTLPVADYEALERIVRLFSCNFVQWKKDLLTSVMPGQQFGSVSTVEVKHSLTTFNVDRRTGVDRGNWKSQYDSDLPNHQTLQTTTGNYLSYSVDGTDIPVQHTHVVNVNGLGIRGLASLDVLSYRKAEMLQAWKQATLRAGNMTSDQFNAHYGVEPDYDLDENVRFLGTWESAFNINPIEATASTNTGMNSAVGDIAATGSAAVTGQKVQFKCNDFGVIVVVSYFRPEADYASIGLDKANTLFEPFDFFCSEFEDLGLEAVPKFVYDNLLAEESDAVLGYAPRYWMYKTALDKLHHGFYNMRRYFNSETWFDVKGSFSPWAAPRVEQFYDLDDDGELYRTVDSFYVNPSVLNPIFAVNVDDPLDTDQFIVNCMLSIRSIRPMSVLGLPQF